MFLSPTSTSTNFITTSHLVRFSTCGHEHTVERALAISSGNQPCHSGGSHQPSAGLWSSSLFIIFVVEPLPHRTGSLQSLPVQVGADSVTKLLVLWAPDLAPHCKLLPANRVWKWTDDSAWRWRCCQLAEFCGDYSTRKIIPENISIRCLAVGPSLQLV